MEQLRTEVDGGFFCVEGDEKKEHTRSGIKARVKWLFYTRKGVI